MKMFGKSFIWLSVDGNLFLIGLARILEWELWLFLYEVKDFVELQLCNVSTKLCNWFGLLVHFFHSFWCDFPKWVADWPKATANWCHHCCEYEKFDEFDFDMDELDFDVKIPQ